MKQIWKQYWRYKRMADRAKWYLDNIQPLSISMNSEYHHYKQLTQQLKKQLCLQEWDSTQQP